MLRLDSEQGKAMPAPGTEMRTRQVWQVLIAKAMNRQTITYKELASLIGRPRTARFMGHDLDLIADHCREHNMPRIAAIVARQDTGQPGSGFEADSSEVHVAREKVFAYPWFEALPYG